MASTPWSYCYSDDFQNKKRDTYGVPGLLLKATSVAALHTEKHATFEHLADLNIYMPWLPLEVANSVAAISKDLVGGMTTATKRKSSATPGPSTKKPKVDSDQAEKDDMVGGLFG